MTGPAPEQQAAAAPELPPAPGERRLGLAMIAAFVATVTLMLWHGAWDDPGWWLTMPFVGVWCCVPYAWAGRTLRAARGGPAAERLAAFGVVAMIVLALLVLGDYHASPDAGRGGRVFVLLPIWQGLVFLPFYGLARWLRPAAAGDDPAQTASRSTGRDEDEAAGPD